MSEALSNLDDVLAAAPIRVDGALDRLLPPLEGRTSRLASAMRYTVEGGGKRFRPVLCLMACHAVGREMYDALNCAAALEMIHAYSLIHDDLPAMDDAKLRRGRPANHLEFGEAHAILAGDGLLTLAFEILVSGYPEQGGNLCGELARGAGWQGMVAGQAADMEEEGNPPTAEVVEYIHRRKTGALITTSLRAGGIVGEANQDQLRGLTVFGDEVGLAFQIIDDILDETVESSRSGKSAGGDRDADKMTYPAVYGVERSRAMAIELTDAGVDALASLPRPDLLVALARRIVRRVF